MSSKKGSKKLQESLSVVHPVVEPVKAVKQKIEEFAHKQESKRQAAKVEKPVATEAKPKVKRVLSEEQKAVLRERLVKAREAKNAKREQLKSN